MVILSQFNKYGVLGFTTMLLEFLILTAVSDILCVFVAVSGNSLSCSLHQLIFNMIVGMMPFL